MNSVSLIAALTRDPERKGTAERPLARLRLVEVNANPEQPLYINVSVFGAQAESCLQHLAKGRQVAVVGRLCFREWERVDRARRSEYWLAADRVDFLARPRTAPTEPQAALAASQ
jgi:single-strand DNA-binding protein